MDFFFRLYWTDPRLNMSALWRVLPTSVSAAGVDLSQLLNIQDVNGPMPNIWMPDIYFPDAMDVNIGNYLLRLHPLGYVEWSRHVTATFVETSFDYVSYPEDTQSLIIRFCSYGLNSSYLLLRPSPSGGYVTLFKNFQGLDAFTLNPIWSYISSYGITSLEVNGFNRYRSTGVVYVNIQRQSSGIIIRLAFPIMLLAILAGLVFWAPRESRANATVSLLLAISALYVVIFQNIPMLGYLTSFDNFVLAMFGIIFASCVVHGAIARIEQKSDIWPLREFGVRSVEAFAKVIIVPLCLFLYFLSFTNVYSISIKAMGTTVAALFLTYMFLRELVAVNRKFQVTMRAIEEKIANNDDVSLIEVICFNFYYYHRIGFTLNYHQRQINIHNRTHSVQGSNSIDSMSVVKHPSIIGQSFSEAKTIDAFYEDRMMSESIPNWSGQEYRRHQRNGSLESTDDVITRTETTGESTSTNNQNKRRSSNFTPNPFVFNVIGKR